MSRAQPAPPQHAFAGNNTSTKWRCRAPSTASPPPPRAAHLPASSSTHTSSRPLPIRNAMADESAIAADSDAFTAALYANELSQYNFDLDALRKWMIAFVVCDFNVDVGMEVEYMFPSATFSPADLQTICFSSFPERTNSDTMEDSAHHFRFRHSSPDIVHDPSLDDPAHWYGFCLFRQQRDPSVKRNYRQKSLVLISQHNFAPLFSHLIRTISMLDFNVPPAVVESACVNMSAWGAPDVGLQELPFLGGILDVHIPPHHAFPLQGLVSSSPSTTDIRVEYKEIHTSEPVGSWERLARLLTSLSELYIIFERVLLSEPLVVLADDPRTCSEFVDAAVDLIRPIPFGGDCRPYLTMQSDFHLNATEGIPFRHYLIGITNPFFLKRLLLQGKECSAAHVVYLAGPEVKRKHLTFYPLSTDRDYTSNIIANDTKGYITKDVAFLRKLEILLKDPDSTPEETSRHVRRHFALLAALFLAPLNRYLATLTSIEKDSNTTDIAAFSEEDFLASLSKYGCSVAFKGKTSYMRHRTAEAFYRKFCRGPGFYTWLEMKMRLQNSDLSGSSGAGTEEDSA